MQRQILIVRAICPDFSRGDAENSVSPLAANKSQELGLSKDLLLHFVQKLQSFHLSEMKRPGYPCIIERLGEAPIVGAK
jgi:hypothetical protein